MSWEFTSIRGLNFAVRDGEVCTFYSEDLATGAVCRAYGFEVGQPMQNPPVHPGHRDIGIGEVGRILRFPSLHELSFVFRFAGHCCPVKMRTVLVGWPMRPERSSRRLPKTVMKWAFSRSGLG